MSNAIQSRVPNVGELRAELEAMVLEDLLEPAGGKSEELTERTVRDRYLVGVLALSRSAGAAAYDWTDLDLGHGFHETKQGVRFTISEPNRREVLQCLLKLNYERYAEEVKQGLHRKKGVAKKAASKPAEQEASLFDGEDNE